MTQPSGSNRNTCLNRLRVREDMLRAIGTGDPAPENRPGSAVSGAAAPLDNLVDGMVMLDHVAQRFLLHWMEVARECQRDLALHFAPQAVRAVELMDLPGVERWALAVMDDFDKRGLGAAIATIERLEEFAAATRSGNTTVAFPEAAGFLRLFLVGLGGRELKLEMADATCTDTETIFVPAACGALATAAENRRRYKLMVAWHWAQCLHGTWSAPVLESMRARPLPATDLAVFAALESLRLEHVLARRLPGLLREMQGMASDSLQEGWAPWRSAGRSLVAESATALDSLDLIADCRSLVAPPPLPWHGTWHPARVLARAAARMGRERTQLQVVLAQLQRQSGFTGTWQVIQANQQGTGQRVSFTLLQDGVQVEAAPELRALLTSIHQDFGVIPAGHLVGDGAAPYDAEAAGGAGAAVNFPDTGYDVVDGFVYPEWDYQRLRFRENFCMLTEHDVEPVYDGFAAATVRKHQGALKSIRRAFEALAGTSDLHRRQNFGNEVDLDALVAARVDALQGLEMPEGLYTHYRETRRDVALMFMVDMSGSTRGWVNRAEKESLVLLCEALQSLHDRHAIYGFSGRTHKRCEVYRIKDFDDPCGAVVRARISGIQPRTYTRMGVALRHLGGKLLREAAATRVLITLSDGKPEDYGSYRGRYGIEDTRHALAELRRAGLHCFCITIDRAGGDYLPHMYGAANYTLVDDVRRLPLKVSDIYRRLTCR